MKGLSIEIYDEEELEPKHHDFDGNQFEQSSSGVDSVLDELDDDAFWDALANIKHKTSQQLSKGD